MSGYGFMNAWKQVDPALIIGNRIMLHRSKNGKQLSGLCPFHPDTDPSLKPWKFSDGKGGYLCSACGACGDIAKFVMLYDRVSFAQAVLRIMKESREATENRQPMDYSTSTKIVTFPMSSATCQDCKQLRPKVHGHYESTVRSLEQSPAGQDWLAKRGIGLDTARKFCIGFVQDGMFAVGDSHPWVRDGWILFPTLTADRQAVTCVKYRSLVAKTAVIDGEKVVGIRCVSSPAMFNLLQIDLSGDVWICEGEPDCLVLSQVGLHAVSIPSASIAPSDAECEMLSSAKRIFLAGDNDGTVGTAAMLALRERLPQEKTHIIRWANGCKDANDVLTRDCGNDREKFSAVIEQQRRLLCGTR